MNAQLLLVKYYSHAYGFFKDVFGINLPGLGLALRSLKRDLVLKVHGRYLFFNHKIGVCYARHFAGDWNEPETHWFLNDLIPKMDSSITFVDIGANVGEFIVDVATHNNVCHLYAFEPIEECSKAISRSCELNDIKNCTVLQKLVGKAVGSCEFIVSGDVSNSSMFPATHNRNTFKVNVEVTTLDKELDITSELVIMLIDAEGAELSIMQGGRQLIEKTKPLIIFEYNFVSKMHFNIASVAEELGPSYALYRLRSDGKLDHDYANAWNCIAINKNSAFVKQLSSLIK